MRPSVLLGLLAFTPALPAAAAAQSEPIDPMTEAVVFQDASKVAALLATGGDANATLGSGEAPLQTARSSAAPDEVVAALLAAGARE